MYENIMSCLIFIFLKCSVHGDFWVYRSLFRVLCRNPFHILYYMPLVWLFGTAAHSRSFSGRLLHRRLAWPVVQKLFRSARRARTSKKTPIGFGNKPDTRLIQRNFILRGHHTEGITYNVLKRRRVCWISGVPHQNI